MGFVVGNDAGITPSTVLPANTLQLNTMPGVLAGELVSLLENKKVTTFLPSVGIAAEGNNTAPLSVQTATASIHSSTSTGVDYLGACELSNGNIAVVVNKPAGGTFASVRSPTGAQVVAEFAVFPTGGSIYSAICALSTGKFAVIYQDATNPSNVRCAIYNNNGTRAVAPFIIYTAAANTNMYVQAAGFNNGNFVVTYKEGTTNTYSYRVYNEGGIAVTAPVNITTVAGSELGRLKRLGNGNVLILFKENSTFKFMVINNVGGVAVAAVTLTATGSNTGPRYVLTSYHACAELSGGNLVFMTPNNADQQPTIYVRSSTGVAVTSFTLDPAHYGSNMTPAIIPNDSGGFAIIGLLNPNFKYSTYSAAGVLLQTAPITIASMSVSPNYNGSGTYCQCLGVHIPAWGYLVIAIGFHDTNTLTTITTGLFSETIDNASAPIWTQIGSSVAQEASTSGYNLPIFIGKIAHRFIPFIYQNNSGAVKMVVYNTMRSSILGVAKNSYDSVLPIPIETAGLFQLPSYQEMGLNVTFDHRTNSVTGNKGTFVARNVNLTGPTL